MRFLDWMRLLARNRFRVHPARWVMALIITGFSVFNSTMACLQRWFFGAKIDKTDIRRFPIFIVGHWRSGTTHLHELLVLDDRFGFPTTYQCFAPHHFLLTESVVTKTLWFIMPGRRPMDNMSAGWGRPQEDEFALANLGAPSPYLRMAFPNHPPVCMETLDMEGLSDEEMKTWKDALLLFLKTLTFRCHKRLVLKSPPHTGRIKVLLEMFPDARFVHITRDPYSLFPSTMRVWEALDSVQGLQLRHDRNREQYVFGAFERMYSGFEKNRHLVPENHLIDIRYEDLVADPVGQLQRVYEQFELSGFDDYRTRLDAYLEGQKDYKTNQHQLDPKLRQRINEVFADYMDRYGYEPQHEAVSSQKRDSASE